MYSDFCRSSGNGQFSSASRLQWHNQDVNFYFQFIINASNIIVCLLCGTGRGNHYITYFFRFVFQFAIKLTSSLMKVLSIWKIFVSSWNSIVTSAVINEEFFKSMTYSSSYILEIPQSWLYELWSSSKRPHRELNLFSNSL